MRDPLFSEAGIGRVIDEAKIATSTGKRVVEYKVKIRNTRDPRCTYPTPDTVGIRTMAELLAVKHVEKCKCHCKQELMIKSSYKRKIIRAGRRSGKTTGIARLAVEAFLAGKRVLYATPTSDQIQTFWFEVKRSLADLLVHGVFTKDESKNIIAKRGSLQRIRAKTAWNADTLRGDKADLLILDEWQLMNEDAWRVVGVPMLADTNGDAVFIYTPPAFRSKSVTKAQDKRHASKLFQSAEEEMKKAIEEDRESRWLALHFRSTENPFVSEQGLREVAKDMTRLAYRQEMEAEDIKEVPGALWNYELIESLRVRKEQVPPLERICVGVDPSGSQTNEVGIVSAGRGAAPIGWTFPGIQDVQLDETQQAALAQKKHYYIMRDSSLFSPSPKNWASIAVSDYHELKADQLCGERNYGGDMVQSTIEQVANSDTVAYKDVNATRGKLVRAQPVATLYENFVVHHVGDLTPNAELEGEMTSYIEGDRSPNRMDAMVWSMWDLMQGQDELGLINYLKSGRAEADMKQADAKPAKELIAKVEAAKDLTKPTNGDQTPCCPSCGSIAIQHIGGVGPRCGQCGKQLASGQNGNGVHSAPASRGEWLRTHHR